MIETEKKEQHVLQISEKEIITRAENFEDMGLKSKLIQGIYNYGYEKPSAIQQKGVIPLIMKKDIIAQAQSGTGKTATIVIGSLQNLDSREIQPSGRLD